MKKFFKKTFLFVLLFSLSIFFLPNFSFSQVDCKTKKECEALLEKYEAEIKQLEGIIAKTKQEKESRKKRILYLQSKIRELELRIKQNSILINDLTYQIKDTEKSIYDTSAKILELQSKLTEVLQAIYEQSNKSSIEILLSSETLSDFFDNLVYLEGLVKKSQQFLDEIRDLKVTLEKQKESLDKEKDELEKTVRLSLLQKSENEKIKKEQERVLALTESQYQKYLAEKREKERKIEEIRARLFELAGISKAPTFGQAYDIAKWVSSITGVRPAFLLAVLKQESNIGKNVGQCYLPRDPQENLRKRIMAAPPLSRRNDVAVFLEITKKLHLDPYKTPVSCPLSVGWGGAMGPAQFIPTTWKKYEPRLKAILKRDPNPWNIQDAFLAAGLYLADCGAGRRTRESEWRAAMIYFAGSTKNKAFYWYANSVLNLADKIQQDINLIEGKD